MFDYAFRAHVGRNFDCVLRAQLQDVMSGSRIGDINEEDERTGLTDDEEETFDCVSLVSHDRSRSRML